MINRKISMAIVLAALFPFKNQITAQQTFETTTAYVNTNTATYHIKSTINSNPYDRNRNSNNMAKLFDSLKMSSVPVQISFTPGLSTQGKQSPKIINSFSLNILGGETGGVNGLEIGGLFNMNRGYVRGLQIGGLFNLSKEYVQGLQVGGLYNKVNETAKGLQIGGIHNMVKGNVTGIQIAGIYNHANDVKGSQVAGIFNYTKNNVKGLQVAGIVNYSNSVNGLQVAGIVNRTKKLRGVQVGLVNIADTSDGYSIGLINIVPQGYHKLAITTNEVMQINVALKTGTKKLYSMIAAGASAVNHDKVYSFGAGLGKEIELSNIFSINPEVSSQYVYLGSFSKFNLLNKFTLDLHLNIGKHLSIFGGPSFSAYYKEQHLAVPGYKAGLPGASYNTFRIARNVDGWIGWNAGISLF